MAAVFVAQRQFAGLAEYMALSSLTAAFSSLWSECALCGAQGVFGHFCPLGIAPFLGEIDQLDHGVALFAGQCVSWLFAQPLALRSAPPVLIMLLGQLLAGCAHQLGGGLVATEAPSQCLNPFLGACATSRFGGHAGQQRQDVAGAFHVKVWCIKLAPQRNISDLAASVCLSTSMVRILPISTCRISRGVSGALCRVCSSELRQRRTPGISGVVAHKGQQQVRLVVEHFRAGAWGCGPLQWALGLILFTHVEADSAQLGRTGDGAGCDFPGVLKVSSASPKSPWSTCSLPSRSCPSAKSGESFTRPRAFSWLAVLAGFPVGCGQGPKAGPSGWGGALQQLLVKNALASSNRPSRMNSSPPMRAAYRP